MDGFDEKSEYVSRKRKYSQKSRPKRYKTPSRRNTLRFSRYNRPVHRFKQTITGSSMLFGNDSISQTNVVQNLSTYFTLNMLGNAGQITSLYDVYRIRKVVFKMYPQCTQSVDMDIVNAMIPAGCIATCIDTDDSAALAALSDYLQYDSCRVQNVFTQKPIIRTIYPKLQSTVFDGAVSLGTSIDNTRWIDCGLIGARYYGIRICVEARASASCCQSWRVFADVYLEAKDIR